MSSTPPIFYHQVCISAEGWVQLAPPALQRLHELWAVLDVRQAHSWRSADLIALFCSSPRATRLHQLAPNVGHECLLMPRESSGRRASHLTQCGSLPLCYVTCSTTPFTSGGASRPSSNEWYQSYFVQRLLRRDRNRGRHNIRLVWTSQPQNRWTLYFWKWINSQSRPAPFRSNSFALRTDVDTSVSELGQFPQSILRLSDAVTGVFWSASWGSTTWIGRVCGNTFAKWIQRPSFNCSLSLWKSREDETEICTSPTLLIKTPPRASSAQARVP